MIQLENIYKTLAGRRVLNGLSLTINRGETFVILGPTGTGKTVTLRHIIGLLLPDKGKVIVDGLDVSLLRGRALEKYRSRFGMVFQSGALINWLTVEENIALPLQEKTKLDCLEIKKRVIRTLRMLDMEDTERMMPEKLSGGMRKRISIARAIVMEPEVLLYDEPTAGLDPIMSRKIDLLINTLKRELKITSLVVTHDLISAFNIADRIAMLYGGRVIECGTPEELYKSKIKYVQKFIEAQEENKAFKKDK